MPVAPALDTHHPISITHPIPITQYPSPICLSISHKGSPNMSEESNEERFRDPELAINRVYTGKGDRGQTRLVGGQKIEKSHTRISAYGTVDELNVLVGAARQTIADEHAEQDSFAPLSEQLLRIQHHLFNLGSLLATLPEDVGEQMPRVTDEDVKALEAVIDEYNEDCPPLRSFVLPGGTRLNIDLHFARTICRRAERLVVDLAQTDEVDLAAIAYLNRLSDAFFVFSRWATIQAGVDEVVWDPNV